MTTNPISLSDAAAAHIKTMLEKHAQGIGFRLSVKKTGCSGFAYQPGIIEKAVAGDIYFIAQQGLPVYVDPECLNYIKDLQIDYVAQEINGLKQKRLVFVNPNEKGRCGCGESFTIE